MIKHVFISEYSNNIVEKAVTHYNDNSVNDDLSTEEIADIKEYYSNNEKSKKFSTVEELLQDLKN